MGSQGPGRKRTPSKNRLTAEEDALNVIAKEAEARLAAKRAARAEAREIRMKELERQQKEEDSERYTRVSRRHTSVSDDEERMSVGNRSNVRLDLDAAGAYGGLPQATSSHSHKKSKKKKKHSSKTVDDRSERDYLEKGSSRASTISGTTLTSLGGTSSRRGSGDTSISADTEASIREIKEIHELKDQIQDVEAKHMQNLKELKDSLLEVEEKYRKAMVSNAQLDNEKTNMMYEVDTLKDSLMELEEKLFETRRELEEKSKDLEREKHAHSILQFQFSELKDTLKQSEELLTEIRQLRLKQDGFVREISDLQETIDWKNKKIGALERQKEFSDAIRNERDELRDEVVQLKDILKKHGIVIGPDLTTNGETGEDVGTAEQNSQTASAEIREGSSVLGTHQLKLFKDQQQKDLDDRMQGNQQSSHAPFSSTNTALKANENEDLGDQLNQGIGQLENRPEEPPSSVCDDELTATSPKEKIKSEAHLLEDSRYDTEDSERKVHKDELMETDQQESEYVKPSKEIKEETVSESVSASVHNETDKPDEAVLDDQIKEETPVESVSPSILDETDKPSEAVLDDQLKEEIPVESVSASIHDETDKPGEAVLDDQLKEESVESSQMEKLPKTQVASASNKKKKRKKKNKQKQKLSDKQESDTKLDDKNEIVLSEDNPNPELDGDLEENHEKPLGNDVSETTLNTDVPHGDKGTNELDCIEITSTNINADNAQDKTLLVTDEADSVEMSKSISNSDCPESNNGVLSDDLSNNIIANPATIIDDHTEDSTIPDPEPVIFSSELMSSETETSLPHEPSAQSMDTVGVCVESSSKNIENSSLVGVKEEKSHLDCEVEEQNERLQNIDLDGDTHSVDKDNSAHSSSPVMEKVENEAEKVIQEQPIDQPMESQLQDSTGANVGLEEVETQNELDVESFNVPCEKVFDECHVDDTPLIETTEFLVIHEDHLSAIEANQESVVESEASDQEPKVENFQEERSIQNQVKINVQLSEDDEDLQVKSDVVLQELKEKDEEEEDEGESFDFDEMDLEAPSDAPLKNVDQPNEDSALLKENAQEASQEYERNVNDEDQPQEDEHLEHADHESKTNEHKDDGHATENPQTATDVDRCLTGDSQTNSEVKPNDQQHDTPDAFDVHQQASEDVTLSKGVHQSSEMKTRDVSQEMETKDVGQEINSSIHHENKASNISGEQEAAGINKENDRKESKKSGKGKGKGKGKEECKMS